MADWLYGERRRDPCHGGRRRRRRVCVPTSSGQGAAQRRLAHPPFSFFSLVFFSSVANSFLLADFMLERRKFLLHLPHSDMTGSATGLVKEVNDTAGQTAQQDDGETS